jgi:hypothetical protein
MKKIILISLLIVSSTTFAINSDVREAKLRIINDAYVKGIVRATKLKDSQVRDFLPGNKNYGKKLGDVYQLSVEQKKEVNQLENQRKNAMFELRKKFGSLKSNGALKTKAIKQKSKK